MLMITLPYIRPRMAIYLLCVSALFLIFGFSVFIDNQAINFIFSRLAIAALIGQFLYLIFLGFRSHYSPIAKTLFILGFLLLVAFLYFKFVWPILK